MRIIVAGSRSITEYSVIEYCINTSLPIITNEFRKRKVVTEGCFDNTMDLSEVISSLTIVSGGAKGVDTLGAKYGQTYNIPVKYFIPDWDTLGKKAGFIRNQQMADYADCLIAIRTATGKSNGTDDMIARAVKNKLMVCVYFVDDLNNIIQSYASFPEKQKVLSEV